MESDNLQGKEGFVSLNFIPAAPFLFRIESRFDIYEVVVQQRSVVALPAADSCAFLMLADLVLWR